MYYRGCLLEHKSGNLEISALASRHLHRLDYQHCKKFKKGPFEFLEALVHFCFLKRGSFQHLRTPLYNNHGGALFKYTCGPSWAFPKKLFRAAILYRICYRLLLWLRNSAADVTTGTSHNFKNTQGSSLQFMGHNLLKSLNSRALPGHFRKCSKTHSRTLVRSLFSAMLQPKDCKPALRLKSNFSKYLEQLCTSRNIAEHVTEFWADLQNAEISFITLLKIDSRSSRSNFENSRNTRKKSLRWILL